MRRRMTVRTKLRLALIGLGVVPIVLLGALLASRTYSAQISDAVALQHEVAERIAGRFSALIVDELESDIRVAARISNLASLEPEDQRSVISRLLSYKTAFLRIMTLNPSGVELARVSRQAAATQSVADHWEPGVEFDEAMQEHLTYYGPVHVDSESGEPEMHIAVPLVDRRSGGLGGIVVADVRLKAVWEDIADTFVGKAGGAFIVDANGLVVAHRNPSVVLRGTEFAVPDDDGIHLSLDGERSTLASVPVHLGAQTLNVVAERPTSEAMALANQTLLLSGAITAVALLFALIVAWFTVTPITRRLTALAAASQAIARGEEDVAAAEDGADELAALGSAFNQMVKALQDKVSEALAARREVTELNEQLEDKVLRRTAQLERSNQELEQFAYVASHDLQEPLRMVASYTQLLEKRYGDQLDEKAKGFIAYAVDGASRMQRLINDLLMYSRVQTKGGDFVRVDLNDVLGQARVNLAATITETGALVTNEDLPDVVADADQLVSVFQNLIGNGIKFSTDETPHVHVSAVERDSEIEVSVRDNGIGIRGDFKDRVFVIFQRLHARREYEGTGIGLALCKRVVERHGGSIWFESEEGAGTTFHFTLPVREVEEAA